MLSIFPRIPTTDWFLPCEVAMAATSLAAVLGPQDSGPFSVPEPMRLLLVSWLLLSSRFWLLGHFSSSNAQMDVGGKRVHWTSWQPWICMCNLNKQARSRHLVAWPARITLPLKASLEAKEFWEERPCSLQECVSCEPEECPDSSERSAWGPPWESFPLVDPHDSEIPLPPSLDPESYDSLPVVDDMGEE